MKESGSLLFIRDDNTPILSELHELFQLNPVSVRPNRVFERNIKKKKTTCQYGIQIKNANC